MHRHFASQRKAGAWFDILFEDALFVLKTLQNQSQAHSPLSGSFEFQGRPIRVVRLRDEPWFLAKDVCACLGFSQDKDVMSRLSVQEKIVKTLEGLEDTLVNELGSNLVYRYA